MSTKDLLIETVVVGPFQCNCMIIADPVTRDGIVIDPGEEALRILEVIRHFDIKVTHILHTHGHLDHIGATGRIHQETGAPILLHKEDLWLYDHLKDQGQLFGIATEPTVPVSRFLEDKEEIPFGGQKTAVLHTPGHTPGSVSFKLGTGDGKETLLFSGDTLFQGSIGRTDLWGGSFEKIMESIKTRLLPLNEETRIYPGHGPATTLWDEKKHNPFVQEIL